MIKLIKPLLATKADYSKIKYPVLSTPKLDGIRCLMIGGVAMSRSMKPIPNKFIQEELKGMHGLDGELMLNGDFNEVLSGIMSQEGSPDFTYHVFDTFISDCGYHSRISDLEWGDSHPRVQLLLPKMIHNEIELDEELDRCLDWGYEGLMIRDPEGKYKHGRSTLKEGILLKIKKFFDDEAALVSVVEQMRNENPKELDELGYTKRKSCKENLVPANTAGSAILNWNGLEFSVGFGPGWTDERKQEFWDDRELNKGDLYTFRYQELSKDGVPRFGKLIRKRHEDDL